MSGRLGMTKASGKSMLVPAWKIIDRRMSFVAWLADSRPVVIIDEEPDVLPIPSPFKATIALVLSEIGVVWLYKRDFE